ncbi:MAG: hypothetical protein JSV91_08715 [Phycisphaerales bacterium]|nr:MAG: hypothetical protein JSV91_08715 [Phycisphaerales bacterium]
MKLRTTFLWAMIISLSAAALIGIAVLLLPDLGPTEEILASTALFSAFSLVALCCAIVLEKRRLVPLMWIGIAVGFVAMLVWLFMVWFHGMLNWEWEERVLRTGGVFTIIACWCAYCGLMSLPRLTGRLTRSVQCGTIGIWALLAVIWILGLCWEQEFELLVDYLLGEDLALRLMGVLLILGACGTVVTPILWRVQALRAAAARESVPVELRVQIVCPRCHTQQELMTGRSKCAKCGLRIRITVEEPRCTCGYLLYRLESDTCPECGRKLAQQDT